MRIRLILGALLLLYVGGYTFHHLGTPLGMSPQLDGKENLALAQQIAGGDFPAEPFYRAMLYPALLSLPLQLGFPEPLLPWLAGLLGMAAHLASAWLLYRIARRVWQSPRAGLLAAVLYGLHPVAVYFAAQPLDITLAITCFLAALDRLTAIGRDMNTTPGASIWFGGIWLGLAILTRPHFIAVAPFVIGLAGYFATRRCIGMAGAWGMAVAILIGGQATLGKAIGGEWHLLPWQGAYNLFAANQPGTDGRYFQHKVFLDDIPEGTNPTRLESEVLYMRETGATPPLSPAAMNEHWRERLRAEITNDFLGWVGLTLRKVYFLGHHWEPYNNQTYAFHRERNPWLFLNPIGWGLLFAGCGLALALIGPRLSRRDALTLTLLACAYAAGVILFIVSARFRLPLAPFLCLGMAGLASYPWRTGIQPEHTAKSRIRIAAVTAVILLLWTFSPISGAYDHRTYVQDKLLIANAAAEMGFDDEALRWSRKVLAELPERPDVRRIALISAFNLQLEAKLAPEEIVWQSLQPYLSPPRRSDPPMELAIGTAYWHLGKQEVAAAHWRNSWQRAHSAAADSLGALLWTGYATDAEYHAAMEILANTDSAILATALATRSPELQTQISSRFNITELAQRLHHLWPR